MTSTGPTITAGITTKHSPRSIEETVARLTDLIAGRGMKLFDVIDQSAEARSVGLHLYSITLVIFGNPVAGTTVMDAVPLTALDLPLKVLVWADGDQTKVSIHLSQCVRRPLHTRPRPRTQPRRNRSPD